MIFSLINCSSYVIEASYISLTTTIKSDFILYNSTNLYISVEQKGDEAAYDLEVKPIESDYFSINGTILKDILYPEHVLENNLTVSLNKKIPKGRYPLVVTVIYHDANMYPFSAVNPHMLTYVEGYSSNVFGEINQLEITQDETGATVLKIRNLEDMPHLVKIRLYLPRELKSPSYTKNITLEPKEEKEIEFEIESFGALTGSSYSILVSLEYDTENYHYSTFVKGVVKIVEKKGDNYIFFTAVIIFIVLLVIYTVYKLRRKNS